MSGPYGTAAADYFSAGWRGVLPLPVKAKRDPPAGYTGADGADASRADIQDWVDNGYAQGNVALRMPADVIGIDVDCYDGKQGAHTLAKLEAKWGPLPATWMSSSRRDGSGIRFYRIPPGMPCLDPGPGIEVIRRAHRYALVWPSIHPDGRRYGWRDPSGDRTTTIPRPDDLTRLPDPWVTGLSTRPDGQAATGWTDPELDQLVDNGIPAGQTQDEILRDVVWKLRGQHVAKAATRAVWDKIVANTKPTRSGDPWTEKDFDRHWNGANKKITDGPTVLDDGPAARLRSKLTDRLYSRGQLRQLPDPESLIDGTLDRRTVAAIAGPYGSLKSFVIVSWACSIATGTPWLGRAAQRGKSLIIAAEGANGVDQRIAAWEDKHSLAVPDDMLSVLALPVNLLDRGQVRELCNIATGATFVAVDTLARCAAGGDENSARDMGLIVEALYQIRDATGDGVATAAHHVPKAGGTLRGSSALEGGVDTIYLTDGGPAQMTLTRTKRKDGPCEDTRTLHLELRKSSGVVADKQADMSNHADILLSAFMSAFGRTGASKAELRVVADMAPATFHRSLNSLLTLGILVNEGTDKRPHYRRAG